MSVLCILVMLLLCSGCSQPSLPVPDFDEVLRDDTWELPLPRKQNDIQNPPPVAQATSVVASPREGSGLPQEGVISGMVIHCAGDYFIVKRGSNEYVFLLFADTSVFSSAESGASDLIDICQNVRVFYTSNNNAFCADSVQILDKGHCR